MKRVWQGLAVLQLAHARRRVHAVVEELTVSAGIPVPDVDVRRFRRDSAKALCIGPGRFVVRIGAAEAMHSSNLQLRGLLGHELAHVDYADPYPETPRDRVQSTLAATAVLLVPILAPGVAAWLVGASLAAVVFVVTFGGAMWVGVPYLVWRPQMQRERSAGWEDRQLVELRADLRAVQIAGRAAAISAREVPLTTWRVFLAWFDGCLQPRVARPHPPDRVRLAVVNGYDPCEDPHTAAVRLFRAGWRGGTDK